MIQKTGRRIFRKDKANYGHELTMRTNGTFKMSLGLAQALEVDVEGNHYVGLAKDGDAWYIYHSTPEEGWAVNNNTFTARADYNQIAGIFGINEETTIEVSQTPMNQGTDKFYQLQLTTTTNIESTREPVVEENTTFPTEEEEERFPIEDEGVDAGYIEDAINME